MIRRAACTELTSAQDMSRLFLSQGLVIAGSCKLNAEVGFLKISYPVVFFLHV